MLGDVATVVNAPEPPIGGCADQRAAGHHADDQSANGANTRDVTTLVEAALQELRHGARSREKCQLHADLFRPANFIDTATDNVLCALLVGGALVIVVLFLFLFDWRTSVISCTAIPLSLLAAVLALQWMGETLNTMTLGGLGHRDRRGRR